MGAKSWLKLAAGVAASAVMAVLTGCGAADTVSSGPLPVTGHLVLSGNVHGGQQPIYHGVIGLWAAGSTGYGSLASNLIGTQTSGGTCGPSMTTSITGFSITSNVVTFTTSAAVAVKDTLQISGLTTGNYFNGFTVTVLTATSTSFTAKFTHADVSSTTDSGTATKVCATDNTGLFSISGDYTCPSASTQVYLTATGGDPTGNAADSTNNTAIQLVAALGACGNLGTGTFIQVNEVTTAAAAFGLAQFYGGFGTTTDSIGTSSTNSNGLINAFATAKNLASPYTGFAASTTVPSAGVYMTGTDQQKLYTLANILSNCVNQTTASSSQCQSLFAAVTPTNAPLTTSTPATLPVNTFQAAVYMNLNPTSTNSSTSATNRAALFNMQSPFMPYAPALSAAPTDWSLALQYTGNGIKYLSGVAIDSLGDVWYSSAQGSANGTSGSGGVGVLNGGTGLAGGTTGVTGDVIGYYSSLPSSNPASPYLFPNGTRNLAVDLQDRAYFGTFGYTGSYNTSTSTGTTSGNNYYLFRAVAGTGIDAYYKTPSTNYVYSVAIDPNGEVFTTTGSSAVFYTSATATSGATLTGTALDQAAAVGLGITHGKVAYAVSSTVNTSLSNWSTTNFSGGTITGNTAISGANFSGGYGAAIDKNNRFIVANQTASGGYFSLSVFDGTSTFTTIPATPSSNNCLQTPQFIAVDGNNNYWVSNNQPTGGTGTNYGICEFDSAGNLLTESLGLNLHGIAGARGIAVDLSGNVWVTNYGASTTNLTQIVGVAVPVVSPISAAVAAGTMGSRP